jgi:ribosome-binding factor A
MKKEFSRAQRVGELIRRELADIIQREITQPTLGLITISGVKVSPDLKQARIYVTQLGGQLTATAAVNYLNQTAGELRHHLARRLTLRVTPSLQFSYDSTIEYGNRLSALIDAVVLPADPQKERSE